MLKKLAKKVQEKVKPKEPTPSVEELRKQGKIPPEYKDNVPYLDEFALSPTARQDLQQRRTKMGRVREWIRNSLGIHNEPKSRLWYLKTREERWARLDKEIEDRKAGRKFYFEDDVRGRDEDDREPWEINPHDY
jgi:hypothetical protein